MTNKVDVSISLNEVLDKLLKEGTIRKALLELAEEKAKGQPVGNIKLSGRTELSEHDLQAVTGGGMATVTSLDYSVLKSPTATLDRSRLANAEAIW
jgi:bacteriocin-like protein